MAEQIGRKCKSAVKDKIRVLPDIASVFNSNTVVEEGFHQNKILLYALSLLMISLTSFNTSFISVETYKIIINF